MSCEDHLFMNKTLTGWEGEGVHSLRSGTPDVQSTWPWSSWRRRKALQWHRQSSGNGTSDLGLSLVDTFPG